MNSSGIHLTLLTKPMELRMKKLKPSFHVRSIEQFRNILKFILGSETWGIWTTNKINLWTSRRFLLNYSFKPRELPQLKCLPADVLWGSFVTPRHGRNECVTNEPQRKSAGRLQLKCFLPNWLSSPLKTVGGHLRTWITYFHRWRGVGRFERHSREGARE